jgi:hypothetical protein
MLTANFSNSNPENSKLIGKNSLLELICDGKEIYIKLKYKVVIKV